MKKTYTKPEVVVENFYLTEAISGCGTNIGNHAPDPDDTLLEIIGSTNPNLFAAGACAVAVSEEDVVNGCYAGFASGFNS